MGAICWRITSLQAGREHRGDLPATDGATAAEAAGGAAGTMTAAGGCSAEDGSRKKKAPYRVSLASRSSPMFKQWETFRLRSWGSLYFQGCY